MRFKCRIDNRNRVAGSLVSPGQRHSLLLLVGVVPLSEHPSLRLALSSTEAAVARFRRRLQHIRSHQPDLMLHFLVLPVRVRVFRAHQLFGRVGALIFFTAGSVGESRRSSSSSQLARPNGSSSWPVPSP